MGLANSTRDYRVSKGVYEGMQRSPTRAVARDQAFQPELGQVPDSRVYPLFLCRTREV